MTAETQWTFSSKRSGYERTCGLSLVWEPEGAPISDDWTPAEITARHLWDKWVDYLDHRGDGYDARLGPGWVQIHWFVASSGSNGVFEAAPFQPPNRYDLGDFLTHFDWPEHSRTGEPLNWAALPVRDLAWNDRQADKGGFIQEATEWKPSALQPLVYLPTIARAASWATSEWMSPWSL